MEIIKNVPGVDSRKEYIQVKKENLNFISDYVGYKCFWNQDEHCVELNNLSIPVGDYLGKMKYKNEEHSFFFSVSRLVFQEHMVKMLYKEFYDFQCIKIADLKNNLNKIEKLLSPRIRKEMEINDLRLKKKVQDKLYKKSKKTIDELFQD